MMRDQLEALERLEFDTQCLMTEHPPIWRHPNKRLVFEIASPLGCVHMGWILFSRWLAMALPSHINPGAAISKVGVREDVYDYVPALTRTDAVEWHVNFADPNLFGYYGGNLFAQDEMQVLEHPALGSLREALDAGGHAARTVEDGRATPVLVMGVERRCRIATDRNAAESRPDGLYGNVFAGADEEVVRCATSRIEPSTITNIIAIAAPGGGVGRYERESIEHILVTAYTGFRAAKLEGARHRGEAFSVVVHTGFWGCGAFGGDRVLMAALQVLAAEMAGLDRLVFHAFDADGADTMRAALSLIELELGCQPDTNTHDLVDEIASMGFEWGVGDGN